jgi:hypothetical protein
MATGARVNVLLKVLKFENKNQSWKFEFLMEIDKSMEISWKSAFPYYGRGLFFSSAKGGKVLLSELPS